MNEAVQSTEALQTTAALLFYVGAAIAIGGALGVVLARSPLRGALSLIVSLCGVALLFLVLDASFVAAVQVLVYAGTIMVLFVFVIMLLNLGPDVAARPAYLAISKVLGTLAAAYFAYRIATDVVGIGDPKPTLPGFGEVKTVGILLLSDYLFAFEAISVLLLIAVVGAVVLGLKRLA